MKIHLHSFPRSGSNYLVCLINYLYECEVTGEGIAYVNINKQFRVTNKNVSLIKGHRLSKRDDITHLIEIIRDPKEAIIRHNEFDIKYGLCKGDKFFCTKTKEFVDGYLLGLEEYENFKKPKLMVFYEDLMITPEKVINEIVNFLGGNNIKTISGLINNLDDVKNWSSKDHKFVDNNKVLTKKFDPLEHQKGISESRYEYYKNFFKEYDFIVNRYFN